MYWKGVVGAGLVIGLVAGCGTSQASSTQHSATYKEAVHLYNIVEKAYHANRRLTAKESAEVESFDVKYSKMRLKEVKGQLKPSDLKSLPHADEQKAVDAIDLLISWYDMIYGAGPGTLSPSVSNLQQLADYQKKAKQALKGASE